MMRRNRAVARCDSSRRDGNLKTGIVKICQRKVGEIKRNDLHFGRISRFSKKMWCGEVMKFVVPCPVW